MDLHPELLQQEKLKKSIASEICQEVQACFLKLAENGLSAEDSQVTRGRIWGFIKALETLDYKIKLSVTEEEVK